MMHDDEIVRTIIAMGRNLGLGVIAEGVETQEQSAKLRDLGCELAQGYYFSTPVSAREATDILSTSRQWTAASRSAKLIYNDRNTTSVPLPSRQINLSS